MNRSDLVKAVANQCKLSQKQVNEVIVLFIDAIALSLECGEEVNIQGLGKFTLTERKAIKKKHPKTGEEISVPRKRTYIFKPAQTFKAKITSNLDKTQEADLQETLEGAESIHYAEENRQPRGQDRQTASPSVPVEVQGPI